MLNLEGEQQLKVVSVVGTAGVGKTTLAKEIFRALGWQFELRAFVRASRNLDMRRFLGSILSQVGQDHELPSAAGPVQSLIDKIQEQLQVKRYFIVIDDLWEQTSWDIISDAFPKVNNCSRIVATTEIMNVALKCCSYMPDNVFKMKPLGIEDSRSLFFSRVFGSEQQCPDELKEVSYDIVKKCVGLPLVLINLAGLLSRQLDYSELWYHVRDHLCSILNRSHTIQDIQEKILNLSYSSLPHCLKTCLLYFNMYPEDYVIWKVHLVKQWIAEGFISATEEKNTEETAEGYFDELVSRGMIQPMELYYTDEVLSCTVHHSIHDLISHNSKEEDFIAAIDYSQKITGLSTKALRLSFRFSSAKYAKKAAGITMSELRSIGFFGFLKCMPPIVESNHLRVLILDVWGTHDGKLSLSLSRICMLFQLRYLKISSDILVELPAQMQGLRYLETLDIDARVSAIPLDIVYLPSLLHLGLHDAIKLPYRIGRIKSLSTLWYFDLRCNSKHNIRSLGKLTNLRHLHLTCSSDMSSDHLERKLKPLVSSLGELGNLKSFTLTPAALRTAIFFDISSGIPSPSVVLQRLELLPPICFFSRLPTWIGELHKLRILKIVVKELRGNDINNISGLPSLVVFSLYVRTALTGSVIFSNLAFPVLKYFKFTCGVMRLAFQAGAMPNLQRLKLCFNSHRGENHSQLLSGIEHLLNLQEVAGRIGEHAGDDGSNSRAVKLSFEDTIRKHPRCPRFSSQFVDFIEEENPPLDKLHRRQQEGTSGEHGINKDCPEDPNKQVDSRLFGLTDLPMAAGTSWHLKSGLSRWFGQELKASLTRGKENLIHHKQRKKIEIIFPSPIKFDRRYVTEVAASISGVESVTMEGNDKNLCLVVIGQVDLVDLVQELSKKLGEAVIAEVRAQVTLKAAEFPLSPPRPKVAMEATLTYALSQPGGEVGIQGARPLLLPLPPPMRKSFVADDMTGSGWDIVRSFAPREEPSELGGAHKHVDTPHFLDTEGETSEGFTGTSSSSTTNDDDSSSTTPEAMFIRSPNGKFKRKIKSWMRGALLGTGSFGMVYEGISDEGMFFAVKEVSLLDQGINTEQSLALEQEIALLSQFEHENIVQYYGTDKEESKLYIFIELVTQGSLSALYKKYKLRESQVSVYTRQILNGLAYLHERNVVHRDIKCANILVHANGSVKLADFGLAKEMSKINTRSCQTSVYWMAPEVINPKKLYGPSADIWSLGCTVLETLTRQIPFPNVEWTNAFFMIGKGEQPPIPNYLSKEAQDFIGQCVRVDPENRPSASQLLEHPFVNRPLASFI